MEQPRTLHFRPKVSDFTFQTQLLAYSSIQKEQSSNRISYTDIKALSFEFDQEPAKPINGLYSPVSANFNDFMYVDRCSPS